MDIFTNAKSFLQLVGAAGIIASLIFIYQSGDEAIAVLNQYQCHTNHTSLNPTSEGLEEFMNIVLPLTAGVYVLCIGALKKYSSSNDGGASGITGLFVIGRMVVVHLPIIVIIMQILIIVMSTCPMSAAHQAESIRFFGYGFIGLGAFFATSSVCSGVDMGKGRKSNINVVSVIDAILRTTAFSLAYTLLNDDSNIFEYNVNETSSCYEYFSGKNVTGAVESYSTVRTMSISQNSKTFKWLTFAFAILTGVEALLQVIYLVDSHKNNFGGCADMFSDIPYIRKIANQGGMAGLLNFVFTATSRLVLTLFIAGMVLDRSELECNPFKIQSDLSILIIIAAVSFIPSTLSQQLEWESDAKLLKSVPCLGMFYDTFFGKVKTGEDMGDIEYSSFMG